LTYLVHQQITTAIDYKRSFIQCVSKKVSTLNILLIYLFIMKSYTEYTTAYWVLNFSCARQ